MATRYSGTLKLTIRYRERSDDYSVRIVELNDDARFKTLTGIRLSPFERARTAGDSARAYDEVARAAISFAGNEDADVYTFAWLGCDGGVVIRRRLDASLREGVV